MDSPVARACWMRRTAASMPSISPGAWVCSRRGNKNAVSSAVSRQPRAASRRANTGESPSAVWNRSAAASAVKTWLRNSEERSLDLDQAGGHGFARRPLGGTLLVAPKVHHRGVMHARHRAVGRARLGAAVLPPDVRDRVLGQRDTGMAALLRAVMHQAVFADVEVAAAGAALPAIGLGLGDVVLKLVEPREAALPQPLHLLIDGRFLGRERQQLAMAVVDDPHRGNKTKVHRALRDGERILGMLHARTQHGVDVDVEAGPFGEQLQLLVEHLQTLDRNLVGLHVVNR